MCKIYTIIKAIYSVYIYLFFNFIQYQSYDKSEFLSSNVEDPKRKSCLPSNRPKIKTVKEKTINEPTNINKNAVCEKPTECEKKNDNQNKMEELLAELNKEKKDKDNLYKEYKIVIDENNNLKNKIKELENSENQAIKKSNPRHSTLIGEILADEYVIAVNFNSNIENLPLNYPLACKNTTLFVRAEEEIYKKFPKFKEFNNTFSVNGKIIKRFKNFEENNISNGDSIILEKSE